MNSWRNLFFLTIVAVIGYGLYVSIMRAPESPPSPPPGAPQTLPEMKVDFSGTSVAQSPSTGTVTTPLGGNPASSQSPPGVEVPAPPAPGIASSGPATSPGAVSADAQGTQAGPVAPGSSFPPSVPPPPASTSDGGLPAPGTALPGSPPAGAVAVGAPAADMATEPRNRVNALLRTATMAVPDRGEVAHALQLLRVL